MPRLSDRQLAIFRNNHGENVPVPPARKEKDNEESRIQCGVINWWAATHAEFNIPEILLFSIPNGGQRSAVTGAILKREGARRGTSDLFLAVRRMRFAGLFIEMKQPDGRLSPEQKLFQCRVTEQGYAAYTCYNYDDAVKLITRYLQNEEIF